MRSMIVLGFVFVLVGCGDDSGGGTAAAGGLMPITGGTLASGGTGIVTGGTLASGGTGVVTGGTGVVTGGTGAGMTAGTTGTGGMVITGGMGAGMAGMGAGGMGGGAFELTSTAVMDGGMLPAMYRCMGAKSPPLSWTAGPAGTMSYAIVFEDVGAFMGTIHWIIYDIPASVTMLAEGASATPPTGAKQGANYMGAQVYTGPCSPLPGSNNYQFTIYALPTATLTGTDKAAIQAAGALGMATLKVSSTT